MRRSLHIVVDWVHLRVVFLNVVLDLSLAVQPEVFLGPCWIRARVFLLKDLVPGKDLWYSMGELAIFVRLHVLQLQFEVLENRHGLAVLISHSLVAYCHARGLSPLLILYMLLNLQVGLNNSVKFRFHPFG